MEVTKRNQPFGTQFPHADTVGRAFLGPCGNRSHPQGTENVTLKEDGRVTIPERRSSFSSGENDWAWVDLVDHPETTDGEKGGMFHKWRKKGKKGPKWETAPNGGKGKKISQMIAKGKRTLSGRLLESTKKPGKHSI